MPWRMIGRYTLSAALFALAACGAWLAVRLPRRRRFARRDWLTLPAVGYLAAVVQIIGLRAGLRPLRPLSGELRLTPLRTTLDAWRSGPGGFVFHAVGNLAWFVPLGLLLPAMRPGTRWRHALAAGAALSVCVEVLQYLLGTGVSDVDDVLFNALGALAGYGLYRLASRYLTRRA